MQDGMKPFPFLAAPAHRPRGTGAFWDYAAAAERRPDPRTTRRRTIDNITYARLSIESERAEQRWDNEGGNTGA
jgi:hypothetical protein